MSQPCFPTPSPASDSDAHLIAVCIAFRRHLLAYKAALSSIAYIKPGDPGDSQVRTAHDRMDAIYHAIEAASRVIQTTPAIGPNGRGAKIMALSTFVKVMLRPEGDLLELDLAMSIIADFVGVRGPIN